MNEELDDYVVKEIDVYLAKSLANNLYVLQVKTLESKFYNEFFN